MDVPPECWSRRDESAVSFLHLSFYKESIELSLKCFGFCQHQQPADLGIEPLRDVERSSKEIAELVKDVLACVVYGGVHRNAGRFVDDYEVAVMHNDPGVPVDAGNREALRLDVDANVLPGKHRLIRSHALAIEIDRPERDQSLCFVGSYVHLTHKRL
jgi:hypothetical protein